GRLFHNKNTGQMLRVTGSGINKMIAESADVRKAKLVVAVPEMTEHGIWHHEKPDTKKGRGTFHYFDVNVSIAGKEEPAHFAVLKDPNGRSYYNANFGKLRP